MSAPNGITVQQAASILGFAEQSVRRLLARGKIVGEMYGNQWYIDEQSVREYRSAPEGQPSPVLLSEVLPPGTDLHGRYYGRVTPHIARLGMTVGQFAAAMGVDESLIFRIDHGSRKATPHYRVKAARLLGMPESALFFLHEDSPEKDLTTCA